MAKLRLLGPNLRITSYYKPPRKLPIPKLPRPGDRIVTLERRRSNPHVLIVTNLYPHEQNERYGIFVKRQVDSLAEAGIRCDVLFIHGYKSLLGYPLAAFRLLWWSISRSRGYLLVHSHGGEVVPFARAYLRAPLVASYLGEDLNGRPTAAGVITPRYQLKVTALRQLSRLTTRTITKSKGMEARLPSSVRGRSTVIPNGVDRQTFAPMERDKARLALGWDATERVVLFVANPAVPRKRFWLAEEACRQAQERIDLRLHVGFPVDPATMPTVMNASDCLLLTSFSEGSPNVVKEALACDLPVVGTRVGDVEELLAGVEPARVCSDDPSELADAIVWCLEQDKHSNGREMTERLDDKLVAQRLLKVYASVAPAIERERLDSGSK